MSRRRAMRLPAMRLPSRPWHVRAEGVYVGSPHRVLRPGIAVKPAGPNRDLGGPDPLSRRGSRPVTLLVGFAGGTRDEAAPDHAPATTAPATTRTARRPQR